MGAVAPVAQVNAELFGKMATTFEAIDRNPPDLKATISESPSTLQVSTQSLAAQQPLLADLTTFGQQHDAGHADRSRWRCRCSTRRSSRARRCSGARPR